MMETPIGRLEVSVDGVGPAAVLMHSLFVDSRSWDRVRGRLASERTLVAITAPGHGPSGDPGRTYSIHEIAAAALGILDGLAAEKRIPPGPADWVGNALGGHAGILAAAHYPERIRSLITLGAPVQAPTLPFRLQEAAILPARALMGMTGWLRQAIVSVLLSERTRAHDPEAVGYVEECLTASDPRLLGRAIRSLAVRRPDFTGLLPRITAPTVFATGTEHNSWPPELAAEAARLLPHGTAVTLPHAAYLLPLEVPEETAQLILRHWSAAEARPEGIHTSTQDAGSGTDS
ncbi:alpha/beta fold hydrolase [Sinomonas sp. P10A9]|uniref:Alpha/beta fold hydrolase n=1 Tax=Sinomonas puerhi TaxID=3238584 RepID=A0AB39L735_9MICC